VKRSSLEKTVLASLMASLTAVGAWISIPMFPVPLVLATVFVLLAGLLLGSRHGAASMLLYLLVGAVGLPVFAGFTGGLLHFVGPTGGYLVGYVAAAFVAGFLSERSPPGLLADSLAVLLGTAMLFLFGLAWLHLNPTVPLGWSQSFQAGLWPFLPGALFKGALAVTLARFARRVLATPRLPSSSP